jgi:hypothetical protein
MRAALVAAVLLALAAGAAQAASPSPPTALVAKQANGTITLTWKAPTSGTAPVTYLINGRSALADTPVPANDQGISWGTPAGQVAAGTLRYDLGSDPAWALFYGETYWISVQAVDAAGVKSAKNPLVAAVAVAAPSAITITRTRAGDGSIAVTMNAGESNGLPVLDYTATASTGQSCTSSAAAKTCTITGLASGTYSVQVCARNAIGTSAPCATKADIAVTAAAAGGGGESSNSSSTTASGTVPNAPTATAGASTLGLGAAKARRSRTAITLVVPLTTAAVANLRLRIVATATRRVGRCTAISAAPADGTAALRCTLGRAARAALRRGRLTLAITATATAADGTTLTATRTQRIARG